MLIAFLLLASVADWVPAHWSTGDPQSISLLRGTRINCVLLERASWSEAFCERAREDAIVTLGIVRPGPDATDAAKEAAVVKLTGVVMEGAFEKGARVELRRLLKASGLAVVELPPRMAMDLDGNDSVIGTCQGLWPGIHTLEDGTAKAAPTGAPWIETNTGLLRFVRASTEAAVWIGSRPPEGQVIPVAQYLHAVGDAAMAGARWILTLDEDFDQRLLKGEPKARADFQRIVAHLEFWEDHRAWTLLKPCGQLAIIEDVASGALLSNGIVDMLTARHTPLRAVPLRRLSDQAMRGARMAVDVDPSSLTARQKEMLRRFTRTGASLLTAPPGWRFPPQRPDQITVDEQGVEKLNDIWHGINSVIGRQNLGVRLFNVASMRSELVAGPGGKPTVLHLVNYSDYPVENVTVRVLGKFSHARLYAPGEPVTDLEIYENGEIEIDKIGACAILALE